MDNNKEIVRVCTEIVALVKPIKVILYGTKVNVSSGQIKNFDVCVIMNTEVAIESEKQIYLAIESELPYNVLVYTPHEWEMLTSDPYSFASTILGKGTVIYNETDTK